MVSIKMYNVVISIGCEFAVTTNIIKQFWVDLDNVRSNAFRLTVEQVPFTAGAVEFAQRASEVRKLL